VVVDRESAPKERRDSIGVTHRDSIPVLHCTLRSLGCHFR
jgi:hypothetical protein